MKLKQIWANLAVEDIEKTKAFYLKLGFKLNGTPSMELVSFLFGEEEFVIHFFEKDALKRSIEGDTANLKRGNEIMFTLAADSKEEIDLFAEKVRKSGGTIRYNPKKDKKKFYDENGYYVCVFEDPDGHLFNLFYNMN
ncbi:VOC family protein [Echinicola salinicaeni]|uniref:VOC family protein n=1 Tax=Echinicola salinicaeni TaxID=2762757 RepID=UPI0016449137|nr:VOC family protein [Echinicola salinicaeni]